MRPEDWYWIVAGDQTRVWSSARGTYVPIDDETYLAWKSPDEVPPPGSNFTTRIDSEESLSDVLMKYDLAGPVTRVPSTVHIAWLEQALIEISKLGAVNAAVAADPATASLWRRVVMVNKSDPHVVAVAAALRIDLDTLFARAEAIRRERQAPA